MLPYSTQIMSLIWMTFNCKNMQHTQFLHHEVMWRL